MQFQDMVRKLSHHQRVFLVSHCEYAGFRPFNSEPIENKTRRSLIIRGLIRYEPRMPGRLGKPQGTLLTDPEGRDAVCMVLGEIADQLSHAIDWCGPINEDRQKLLHDALVECARHWRNEDRKERQYISKEDSHER